MHGTVQDLRRRPGIHLLEDARRRPLRVVIAFGERHRLLAARCGGGFPAGPLAPVRPNQGVRHLHDALRRESELPLELPEGR